MANYAAGFAFAALLYYSSTFGSIFLLTPVLPLIWLRPSLGRRVIDLMLSTWKLYAVALYEVVFGVRVVFTGHPGSSADGSLVLMNHRTRLDWLFYFSYELRYGTLNRGKIILKSLLKNIPGPGWAMQCGLFMFLHRKWETDKPILSKVLNYFRSLNYKPQILLFPEGTDFTKNTKAKSDAFAKKQNLPAYNYVLHPRTTGFNYLVKKMMKGNIVDTVTDVTVAYPKNIPQNEADLVKGNFPQEIHFHVNCYPISAIDTSDEGLTQWCQKIWKNKDKRLEEYYVGKKEFTPINCSGDHMPGNSQKKRVSLYLYCALMFWTGFEIVTLWLLLCYSFIRWYALLSAITFTLIGYFFDGMDMVQTSQVKD